ncbi:MAG: ABC transporter permease [SAR324 cluster bacterium]|nr:ABC transporter permease [SAR324 cluster bacterium]
MEFPAATSFAGFTTLLQKECMRFIRVAGQTLISPLISVSLYLLIFGINLADKIANQNGVNYLQFIIPGLVALALLNNAFQNASSSIIISKFHGDLQDLKVVPLTPSQIVWAYAFAGTIRGFLVGISVACIGEIFYVVQYGELLVVQNWLQLCWFLIAGGVTFSLLGLSVALFANNFDQVSAVGTFVILPLIYLGGVFFSIANMHPFWKMISYANPLLYLINGIRYSFLGVSDIDPSRAFLLTLFFVAGAYLLARRMVQVGSYTRF